MSTFSGRMRLPSREFPPEERRTMARCRVLIPGRQQYLARHQDLQSDPFVGGGPAITTGISIRDGSTTGGSEGGLLGRGTVRSS